MEIGVQRARRIVSGAPEDFDPLIDRPPSRYVVGIDLGTTNSAVTYVDTQESDWRIQVLMIPQRVSASEVESLDVLPSFYFQPLRGESQQGTGTKPSSSSSGSSQSLGKVAESFFVGSFARDEATKTPARGISSAKSWLCHAAVDRTAALLPWHGATDVERLSPVEVSAAYLRHIRQVWDQQFPAESLADQDIILTLPASFDEVARELTVAAAASAGLSRVVLIEEPQAAFYAWVYKHRDNWETKVEIGQKILVCDIGGGTTDFTLIRVRKAESELTKVNPDSADRPQRIQFHRVAVGQHLILGGDNLDLAIAKYLEQRLSPDKPLDPYQWDTLVGSSRHLKEQLLQADGPTSKTINLAQRGSKLIGGSLQAEVTREEIQTLILEGFLPRVSLQEKPFAQQSGFQEFGLPYASDPAITRYLAQFLREHATAGSERGDLEQASPERNTDLTLAARPDAILFNGGFFASPILRARLIEQIAGWFSDAGMGELPRHGPSPGSWQPIVLDNDRLDLAVARGAAYYGMVRRDQGVRIAATLARSYYLGIGGDPPKVICIMPGSAEPGDTFVLDDRIFQLTLSQPVEFSIYVSSLRLADRPGTILPLDREQISALPPIRTVLRAKSRNEKKEVGVRLQIGLSEIGTIELACQEVDSERSWQLNFDVRSTTQTDRDVHQGGGEAGGIVDDQVWRDCDKCLRSVFELAAPQSTAKIPEAQALSSGLEPKLLVNRLAELIGDKRDQWPMTLLRRIWETLYELESGRHISPQHEARWLNLLGFSLRPGYGVALDDWRVTETWRQVNGRLRHTATHVRNEVLILWRRLAGGLSRGQQAALAEPWIASLRSLVKQMSGAPLTGKGAVPRPEELIEVWRLLGSLELLTPLQKTELGNWIVALHAKPKMRQTRDAMIWALGRLGQRVPVYGPLNSIVPPSDVGSWIAALINLRGCTSLEHLCVVQMARMTGDRYRDIDEPLRKQVIAWLTTEKASEHYVTLVQVGGKFDSEEQTRIFGEALPPGLRLE